MVECGAASWASRSAAPCSASSPSRRPMRRRRVLREPRRRRRRAADKGGPGARKAEAMTLNDILQSAQGGRAVHNMAARFDLSDGEAQAAAQAMIPAFSLAFERLAAHPATLGGLLVEMTNGAHAVSYAAPGGAEGALSPNAL